MNSKLKDASIAPFAMPSLRLVYTPTLLASSVEASYFFLKDPHAPSDRMVLSPVKDSWATALAAPYALFFTWACSLFSFTSHASETAIKGIRPSVKRVM